MNLAIIPARGGSKRIPRKNIKNFFGKPIIAYSIELALNSGLFDEVMVSTDDEEIAEIAKQYGASIPFFRSQKTSDDFATLSDVIEEVKIEYFNINKHFDTICLILPTAPFISTADLFKSYELLNNDSVDSVRPIVKFHYPIQRAYRQKQSGLIEMIQTEYMHTRSQDLEPAFHDAGMFYTMKWDKGLVGNKKYAFEISGMKCHDIDTLEDWEIAEFKYQLLNK